MSDGGDKDLFLTHQCLSLPPQAVPRLAAARSRHGSDSPPDCHSLPPHPPGYSPVGLITRPPCGTIPSVFKEKNTIRWTVFSSLYRAAEKDIMASFEKAEVRKIIALSVIKNG